MARAACATNSQTRPNGNRSVFLLPPLSFAVHHISRNRIKKTNNTFFLIISYSVGWFSASMRIRRYYTRERAYLRPKPSLVVFYFSFAFFFLCSPLQTLYRLDFRQRLNRRKKIAMCVKVTNWRIYYVFSSLPKSLYVCCLLAWSSIGHTYYSHWCTLVCDGSLYFNSTPINNDKFINKYCSCDTCSGSFQHEHRHVTKGKLEWFKLFQLDGELWLISS